MLEEYLGLSIVRGAPLAEAQLGEREYPAKQKRLEAIFSLFVPEASVSVKEKITYYYEAQDHHLESV